MTEKTAEPQPDYRPPAPVPPATRRSLATKWLKGRHCTISFLAAKSYDSKLGHVRLPGHDLYTVCEPGLVRRVLVEQWARFPKSDALTRVLKVLIGDAFLITNGELWQRQRRMVDPAFASARLSVAFPLMQAAVEDMQQRLDGFPDGSIVEVDVETTRVTADIIFRTIFSKPVDELGGNEVFAAFNRYQEAATRYWTLTVSGLPSFLSLHRFKAAKEARGIRKLLKPLVRDRYEGHRRGEAVETRDILGALIQARDPETGAVFGFDELVDQVAMLFFAGHETSASALGWAVYLVAACPHIQERIRAETLDVAGDRAPDFGAIKQLKFTRDVFRESLRLYPPVGFIMRQAGHTECMRDKVIKPESAIAVSPWLIHRHRTYWDRPDVFDPDRFASEATKTSIRTAYLPFSLGPRACIGASFAMQEATLILASLARRYRFEALPDQVPKPIGRLTIRSANGIKVRIFRR
ncbi:MAG TPA: cytochrome P450 [Aestuariivirgaceae bacterium]|nr:cytochrome P450 [Aestuariivirgaceae bacterium]